MSPSSNATSLSPFTRPVIWCMHRAWNLVIVVLQQSLTRRQFHTVLKTFSYVDAFPGIGVWNKVRIECVGIWERFMLLLRKPTRLHMLNLPNMSRFKPNNLAKHIMDSVSQGCKILWIKLIAFPQITLHSRTPQGNKFGCTFMHSKVYIISSHAFPGIQTYDC